MSREIKFRAWHKKYKEMYEVTCIDWEAEFVWVKYYDDDREEWFSREEHFADLELMQYTGLKDKNGVEIYEYSELDSAYEVIFKDLKYSLRHIPNNDIIDLHDYWRDKNGEIEVTREYTKV